jgi:hypothetical protein
LPGVPANAQSSRTNNKTQIHRIAMDVTALVLIIPSSDKRETKPIVHNPKRRRSIKKATTLLAKKSRTDLKEGTVKRIAIAKADSARLRKK